MEIMDLLNRIKLSSILGPDPNNPLQRTPQPMDEIPRPNYPINMQSNTEPTVPIHSAPLDLDRPTSGPTNEPFITQPTKPSYDYTPEHEGIDQMHQLIANMPQRHKPSMMRKIFGGIEQALGGGPGAYDNVTNGPYYQEMQDWYTKFKPVEDLANQERGVNTQNRQFAQSMNSNDLRQKQLDETAANNAATQHATQSRIALETWKAQHPNVKPQADDHGLLFTVDPLGKVNYLLRPDGEPIKTIDLTPEQRQMNALELAGVNNTARKDMNDADNTAAMERVNAQQSGANQRNANTIAGEAERAKLAADTKAQVDREKMSANTRSAMERAKIMLPHIPEVVKMAKDLDRRQMFGPIMSRIRNYASKIGTTGDAEDYQRDIEDFNYAVNNDDFIKKHNDFAVGKFLTSLEMLASGTGVVHSRVGSVQLIQSMKNMLSSDNSLDMFLGRVSGVEDYLKGYAAGPNSGAEKTGFDAIIDKALNPPVKGAK